ncbi:MAG: hypothetical protein KBB55_03930 [Candidatus Buchananbacteria bacterium]|nr:hypothetical protein [Candidatus Buchananbacteria bacterium]
MNKEEAGLVQLAAVNNLSNDEIVKLARLMRKRFNYSLTDKPKAARNIVINCQPMHCYEILRELAGCQELVRAETIIANWPRIQETLATLQIAPLRPPQPQKVGATSGELCQQPPKNTVSQRVARQQLFDSFTDEELWKIFLLVARDNLNLRPRYLSQATIRTCDQSMVGTNLLYRSLHILLGLGSQQIEYGRIIKRFPRVHDQLAQLPESEIVSGHRMPWLSKNTPPPMPENLTLNHAKLGEIVITQHAWMSFCKRYCIIMNQRPLFHDESQAEMRQILTELLSEAELEAVDPGIRVIRIINNDFNPAYYLRVRSHNLRFVTSEPDSRNPKPILLTVEIAVRGAKFVSAEPK